MKQASVWNSLEIVKLIVSILTPVIVAIIGIVVARAAKRAEARAAEAARAVEDAQWANRRAVERLIELHKEMAPLLNDLRCFFGMIGHFREIDPPGAITRKRQLDRVYFANEHLFGMTFRDKYQTFIRECFRQWQSPGQDAKLRASAAAMRAERGPGAEWDPGWDELFDGTSRERRHQQRQTYNDVMAEFAVELGLARA